MTRAGVLFAALALCAGCAAPGMAPPSEKLAGVKRVHVVAMEPLPMMAQEMPSRSPETRRQSRVFTLPWMPAVVLAHEVGPLLAAGGFAVTVATEAKEIPGVKDRGYPFPSLLLVPPKGSWEAAFRAWYADNGPVANYRGLAADPPSLVLEIGTELTVWGDSLLPIVYVKVIAPSAGSVIGRSRVYKAGSAKPKLPPLDEALANDAILFKEIYSTAGRELLRESFSELGLLR